MTNDHHLGDHRTSGHRVIDLRAGVSVLVRTDAALCGHENVPVAQTLIERLETAIRQWVDADVAPVIAREHSSADKSTDRCEVTIALTGTPEQVGQFGPETDESFTIEIDEQVRISAVSFGGAGHAISALTQLAATDTPGSLEPAVIHDQPTHSWRSLSVDLARNFVPVDLLREVIDIAAEMRLNVLHLHLTDDQGWRLDIPGLPDLVARSSQSSTLPGGDGYLSIEDFTQLQLFAARRGMVLVPEIDMPGHTHAALYALPELRGPNDDPHPYTGINVGFSKLHRDNPATRPFIARVVREMAAMTTGQWLHVGGDECHQMTDDEYRELVQPAVAEVLAAGKTPVLWQEAAKVSLDPSAWVTVWDLRAGLPAGVREHAERGGKVIAAPAPMAYLDSKYSPRDTVGQDWAGCATLRSAYDWRICELLRDDQGPVPVHGVEAAIWTETIQGRADFMHMLLPRLAAISEIAWMGDQTRDVDEFVARAEARYGSGVKR
ncbi:hexosaminidase [Micrococcales bacterium KH10]|nr:hexosaminidase [Micrococcales bacterium KH10]